MLYPIKLMSIELTDPINSLTGLEAYTSVQIMVRLHGRPVGYITAPVTNSSVDSEVLNRLILATHKNAIIKIALQNAITAEALTKEFCLDDLFNIKPRTLVGNLPLVTVAVCTRNRASDLDHCLEAI